MNEEMIKNWRAFLIYLILFQIFFLITNNKIFIIILLFFSIIGLIFKKFPKYLYKLGNFFAEINTKVILFLLFIFFVCPMSFLRKITIEKSTNFSESYWDEIDFKIEKEEFEKMG